jgi:hypothetical protein
MLRGLRLNSTHVQILTTFARGFPRRAAAIFAAVGPHSLSLLVLVRLAGRRPPAPPNGQKRQDALIGR